MRLKHGVVLLLFVFAAFAGCLGDDDDPPQESDPSGPVSEDGRPFLLAEANDLERELDAIQIVPADDLQWARPNLTKDDWLFLSTPMSEEGGVTAFRWEFPEDGVYTDPAAQARRIALDFAIALDVMGSAPGLEEGVDWILLAFQEQYDEEEDRWETVLGGSRWSATMEEISWSAGASPTGSTSPADATPFTFKFRAGDHFGKEIYFVLGARGPPGEPFGIGVRMLSAQAASGVGSPTADWSDFVRSVGTDLPPYVPERVHESQGIYLHHYEEETAPEQSGRMQRAVQDTPLPTDVVPDEYSHIVMPRATEITSRAGWGGWSSVEVRYASLPDTSWWTISGNVHGRDVDHSVFLAGPVLRVCLLAAEGSDAATLENQVINGGSLGAETLRFKHISVNVQAESLTGTPFRVDWRC